MEAPESAGSLPATVPAPGTLAELGLPAAGHLPNGSPSPRQVPLGMPAFRGKWQWLDHAVSPGPLHLADRIHSLGFSSGVISFSKPFLTVLPLSPSPL